jgi:hypothetical protein
MIEDAYSTCAGDDVGEVAVGFCAGEIVDVDGKGRSGGSIPGALPIAAGIDGLRGTLGVDCFHGFSTFLSARA